MPPPGAPPAAVQGQVTQQGGDELAQAQARAVFSQQNKNAQLTEAKSRLEDLKNQHAHNEQLRTQLAQREQTIADRAEQDNAQPRQVQTEHVEHLARCHADASKKMSDFREMFEHLTPMMQQAAAAGIQVPPHQYCL